MTHKSEGHHELLSSYQLHIWFRFSQVGRGIFQLLGGRSFHFHSHRVDGNCLQTFQVSTLPRKEKGWNNPLSFHRGVSIKIKKRISSRLSPKEQNGLIKWVLLVRRKEESFGISERSFILHMISQAGPKTDLLWHWFVPVRIFWKLFEDWNLRKGIESASQVYYS